ncbi:hypothetical protein TNCV_2020841 [Trichonephila clavipes]|nr:hypothetical protein TNCV_2020841 [Trichonephila clavipes]
MTTPIDGHIKQRSVIQRLTQEGCSPIEIHRRMKVVYGDGCVDVRNVRNLFYTIGDLTYQSPLVFDSENSRGSTPKLEKFITVSNDNTAVSEAKKFIGRKS